MIAYLSGILFEHTKDGATVLCGNVGYEVIGQWLIKRPIDLPVDLYIYEYLENESIPRMIGFRSSNDRNIFLQLLTVSGVGPKMASRIVDTFPSETLMKAITTGDVETLTAVKGLGKKTAQKIVLELGKTLVTEVNSAHAGLYEALGYLKFSQAEISEAIKRTELPTLMTESEQLTAVLKTLGSQK